MEEHYRSLLTTCTQGFQLVNNLSNTQTTTATQALALSRNSAARMLAQQMTTLLAETERMNLFFKSANGVPPNARVPVPTTEWQALYEKIRQLNQLREHLLPVGAEDEPKPGKNEICYNCWCASCSKGKPSLLGRMILCPECGDKRCPRAADHNSICQVQQDLMTGDEIWLPERKR